MGLPHPRPRAAMFAMGLALAALSAALASVASPAPFGPWVWVAVWFAVWLLGGGLYLRMSWAAGIRPVAVATAVVVAIWVAALASDIDLGLRNGAEVRRELLALGLAIGSVLAARALLARLLRPRSIVLCETASLPGTPAPALGFSRDLRADAEALSSAILPFVEDTGALVLDIRAELAPETVADLSWRLRKHGVHLRLPLEATALSATRAEIISDAHRPAVLVSPPRPSLEVRVAKRICDLIGAALILLAVSPLMLGAALAIALFMPGPIFYRQERIGLDGRPFDILKFRSMVVNADARLPELLAQQQGGSRPLFKVDNDPRITPLGAFLRRSSIDELPQLINVLRGDMSLVGPRPQRAAEVDLYTGIAGHRLGVLPGMTGLWQVSGRSDLSWERAQQLDVYYAHNWSLRTDLTILARTARAVLQAAGAR